MNKEWVRKTIREFEPYKAPEMKEKIIINANEGCYNIFDFPAVKADFLKGLAEMEPYRYPSPFAEGVRQALGDYLSVKAKEILCGNGGDEIIQLILNAFIDPGDTVLDFFAGSGTTGDAALELGRSAILVDDNPEALEVMETRLARWRPVYHGWSPADPDAGRQG